MDFMEKYLPFLLGFFLCILISRSCGESSTCLTVYEEGGAPAVFQSPKCPRWKLSDYGSTPRSPSMPSRCHAAVHQGRRRSQEDRTLCALDIRIPFPGPAGITEVTTSLIAVFDGHNGAEASEMASKRLLDYFMLHTYFLLDTVFSIISAKWMKLPDSGREKVILQNMKWDDEAEQYVIDFGRLKMKPSSIFERSACLELLKEALLRAIEDIDVAFSRDALHSAFKSGSTATVILMADNEILVANVGDSKAFLCSEVYKSSHDAKANLIRLRRQKRVSGENPSLENYRTSKRRATDGMAFLVAKELTKDHHPDRDEERFRVEAAGGYVSDWGGVARVNGELAVSRAIGDVHLKRYGVTSVPEVTDWQPLTTNDSYLVAASDGIFEKLSAQEMCDIFWELLGDGSLRSEDTSYCPYLIADRLVSEAFERGSMDNMAAIVIPLGSTEHQIDERCRREGKLHGSTLGYQNPSYELTEEDRLDLLGMGHAQALAADFDRLVVDGKCTHFQCFYLSENLNENDDYTFWIYKDDQEFAYDYLHALPGNISQNMGGQLDLYNDQHVCMHFGMSTSGDKDRCINPEGFARFLGLLESIPFHENGLNDHIRSNYRYVLKKKCGRGSYGEVWLAFHWNCSVGNASKPSQKDNRFYNDFDFGVYEGNSGTRSAADDKNGAEESMFILKRVMVEKGAAVYLSGLREKYFGEIFLNATLFLEGVLSSGSPDLGWRDLRQHMHGPCKETKLIGQETENNEDLGNDSRRRRTEHKVVHEEGLNHIARYVESFESRSNEIWLVFRHEGASLSKFLYTAAEVVNNTDQERDAHSKNVQILYPSKWWHWLKTTEAGQEEMRSLIRQLLMALKSCHLRNITHRDIKPENMVICLEDQRSGGCLKGSLHIDADYSSKMRIIDFGSAIDEFTVKHLYGSGGPSRAEQTDEYSPPEALLNSSWYLAPASSRSKYDMWSVGVVMLELILGSPNVFQISSKTRVILDKHLDGWSEALKELAYKLRSLMELCILVPGVPSKVHHSWGTKGEGSISPASWKCSEEFFSNQVKSRDPLKIGFPNVWALRLVRELLRWNPEDRLTADEALGHPYFTQPWGYNDHAKS